ncbi:uncharacterized protein LOC113564044 [Drosophila erecta]|uniref:uncharacterized protein LOC113564044 n=1 Tax=Drosophila erecta TaxID=7220 RepID=UPI000F0593C6|nr:uncharacterized protein LOC113564044 [Drosophila erecta]
MTFRRVLRAPNRPKHRLHQPGLKEEAHMPGGLRSNQVRVAQRRRPGVDSHLLACNHQLYGRSSHLCAGILGFLSDSMLKGVRLRGHNTTNNPAYHPDCRNLANRCALSNLDIGVECAWSTGDSIVSANASAL